VDDPNLATDLLDIFGDTLLPPLLADICHLMRRYCETLPNNHPLKGKNCRIMCWLQNVVLNCNVIVWLQQRSWMLSVMRSLSE
jgi:hypothetical protein